MALASGANVRNYVEGIARRHNKISLYQLFSTRTRGQIEDECERAGRDGWFLMSMAMASMRAEGEVWVIKDTPGCEENDTSFVFRAEMAFLMPQQAEGKLG